MRIAVVYCYPLVQTHTYFAMAKRFVKTWLDHPPGHDHELYVTTTGTHPGPNDLVVFQGLPARFVARDNVGWDIGCYQWAADNISCDLLVCLGAHVHFHHEGWLKRMVDAWVANGPGIYGCWGYDAPDWHLRTTAFWISPELLSLYPETVTSQRASRYAFEHGNQSITLRTIAIGFPACMVTMNGCFAYPDWPDHIPSREDSLLLDRFQEV